MRVLTSSFPPYWAMEEADDDGYMNQPWADSKALKRSMHGTGAIGLGSLR